MRIGLFFFLLSFIIIDFAQAGFPFSPGSSISCVMEHRYNGYNGVSVGVLSVPIGDPQNTKWGSRLMTSDPNVYDQWRNECKTKLTEAMNHLISSGMSGTSHTFWKSELTMKKYHDAAKIRVIKYPTICKDDKVGINYKFALGVGGQRDILGEGHFKFPMKCSLSCTAPAFPIKVGPNDKCCKKSVDLSWLKTNLGKDPSEKFLTCACSELNGVVVEGPKGKTCCLGVSDPE